MLTKRNPVHETKEGDGGTKHNVPDSHEPRKSVSMGSRMTYSRLIGALFLAGFLSYGVGSSLVTSVVGAPDFLSNISALQSTLVLGAFLMLLNSAVDVGKGVLFFPILENHGKRTALAYLAAMIFEVVLMAVGVLFLLMIVPLAQQGADAGVAKALGSLAVDANTMAYQIGQLSLGIGAVFLCWMLFRTRLVPRFLAGWGLIGYAIHAAGASAEIFGIHISLILLIPGGLFELVLAFWLLIKGFQPEAYGGRKEVRSDLFDSDLSDSDVPERSPNPNYALAEGETR